MRVCGLFSIQARPTITAGKRKIKNYFEKLSTKEQALKIFLLLHQLTEPYKEVFMLRILGELKFKEIANIFGKSESWAKVTFYRAKDKLVKRMEEENEN